MNENKLQSIQSLRKRRLSVQNRELYLNLCQIQELISSPSEPTLKQYLEKLKYLSTQIQFEKEIECSFILITSSFFMPVLLAPLADETSKKLKEFISSSKSLFSLIFSHFTKSPRPALPQKLLNETSSLLTNMREFFSISCKNPPDKVKILSKILSMVPSTPFELLLVSLSNLLSPIAGSNLFPCFTHEVCPYLPDYIRHPYTLVLDLDETLVHLKDNKVFIRPGARDFINSVSQHYELVLFTSATPTYADYIMQFIDPSHLVKLRLYRTHTTKIEPVSVKNLQNLGRDLSKVIIVDNLKESFMMQEQNGVHIKSWTGDEQDNELSKLLEALVQIPYKNFSHVAEGLFSFLNNK